MQRRARRVRMQNQKQKGSLAAAGNPGDKIANVDVTGEIGERLTAYGKTLNPEQNRKQVTIGMLRFALAMTRKLSWHEMGRIADEAEREEPPAAAAAPPAKET